MEEKHRDGRSGKEHQRGEVKVGVGQEEEKHEKFKSIYTTIALWKPVGFGGNVCYRIFSGSNDLCMRPNDGPAYAEIA